MKNVKPQLRLLSKYSMKNAIMVPATNYMIYKKMVATDLYILRKLINFVYFQTPPWCLYLILVGLTSGGAQNW